MNKQLYIIGFRWITNPEGKPDEVEKVLAALGNWARLNIHVWLFWTSEPLSRIDRELRNIAHGEDSVFIIAADHTQYAGWSPQLIWNWLKDLKS